MPKKLKQKPQVADEMVLRAVADLDKNNQIKATCQMCGKKKSTWYVFHDGDVFYLCDGCAK